MIVAEAERQLGVVEPEGARRGLGRVMPGLEELPGDAEARRQLAQGLDRGGALAALDLRDVLGRDARGGDVPLGEPALFAEPAQALTNCLLRGHRSNLAWRG